MPAKMRDKTHMEQVERWADYVRDHPKEWKAQLKPFIDSQIIIANRFYAQLPKEKARELRLAKGT